jgi:hypothetical protein
MARVKNLDQITGNLKNLSFYTRKGSEGIIVRTKGGASKEKIKRDPAFAGLRKANKEFGGCSKMGKQIRMAFYGLEHVAEYNLSSALSKLAKDIQKTDSLHPVGERDIRFSAYRFLLKGFDFGRTTRFASLLRVPLAYTLVRQRQEAVLQIPAFACSFGLNMPDTRTAFSYFRITAALGIVTDMALNPQTLGYEPVHDKLGQGYRTCSTEWYSTQGSVPEQELSLSLMAENVTSEGVTQQTTSGGATSSGTPTAGTAEHPYPIFNDSDSLLLTVVLEFGAPDAFGHIMPVRGVGGGMVLGVE